MDTISLEEAFPEANEKCRAIVDALFIFDLETVIKITVKENPQEADQLVKEMLATLKEEIGEKEKLQSANPLNGVLDVQKHRLDS